MRGMCEYDCPTGAHIASCEYGSEPVSLLEQVDMEIAALLEPPAWWGDDPFAGIPNSRDEDNEPF